MHSQQKGHDRLTDMLITAMGPIGTLLLDDAVIELMLNPDGSLWQDRLGEGRSFTGHKIPYEIAERMIYIVANSQGAVCNKDNPLISAELPLSGSRFQGILPPLVKQPTITIRKKSLKIFTLNDYVAQGIMQDKQAQFIQEEVRQCSNILIVGGTGSGKTTLANALLAEIAQTKDRVIIIEDTPELQCCAEDVVAMQTSDKVGMTELLKATMRLRPDRIVIGEVRGPEALALLKAWNTGHPGGIATIHASSALKGLSRLEHLIQESGQSLSKNILAETVNVIIYIEKTNQGRQVKETIRINGFHDGEYLYKSPRSVINA